MKSSNYLTISIYLILISCSYPKHDENKRSAEIVDKVISVSKEIAGQREVEINLDESIVYWKGTKLTGKHEGTVRFSEGMLMFDENGNLIEGNVTVSMKTINITDIPEDEPVPRRNLMNHFIDEFDLKQYTTASFSFEQVRYSSDNEMKIFGNLEIKGVNKEIEVTAINRRPQYISEFTINRFDWGIGEDGSWFAKRFVDEEIELRVVLVLLDK